MNSSPRPAVDEADFARLLAFRDGLRRFTHWSEEQAKRAGLTGARYQLLLAVRGHGSRPSLGEVAEHLLLRHHSVVELVDRAEAAGLLRRVPDDLDQRIVRLELTPEGVARLTRVAAAHVDEVARLRSDLELLWSDLPSRS